MTDCKFKLKCGAYFERDENCVKTPERCMIYGFRNRLTEMGVKGDYYNEVKPYIHAALRESNLMCWEEE